MGRALVDCLTGAPVSTRPLQQLMNPVAELRVKGEVVARLLIEQKLPPDPGGDVHAATERAVALLLIAQVASLLLLDPEAGAVALDVLGQPRGQTSSCPSPQCPFRRQPGCREGP